MGNTDDLFVDIDERDEIAITYKVPTVIAKYLSIQDIDGVITLKLKKNHSKR